VLTGTDHVVAGTDGHVVLFHEDDHALGMAAADHLAEVLVDDGCALVVATRAHRDAIEDGLLDLGLDVEAVRDEGRLVMLDGEEVLERLTVDGHVDRGRFDEVVGATVRRLAAGGTRVRAFGDIVGVLWHTGRTAAALRLERLWNDLRRAEPFPLLCAYPAPEVEREPGGRDAICRLHTGVVAEPRPEPVSARAASRGFVPAPSSARVARRFVADVLERWGRTDLVDTTALVVGELVGNAIRHGLSRYRVTVASAEDGLRIEVADLSAVVPQAREGSDDAVGGRGLHLVEALSRRWGTDVRDDGKTVWAEIAASA
jgi:anti-sigma regulatory factor (Ser/Thr protein kinase)